MNVNVNYDPMAGSEQVKRTCPECETVHFITVDKEGYARWKAGELLQNALPALSADDRETLLTGICPPCWDGAFELEEEEPLEGELPGASPDDLWYPGVF